VEQVAVRLAVCQIGGAVNTTVVRVRSFTKSFLACRTRVRSELAADLTTAVLVALLVGAWCIAGVLDLTGLPHGVVVLVDLSEVVLCVWLGARLAFAREIPRSLVLVVGYALWVLTGLVTHAPPAAAVTALSHWLVLPALAFFVAARGTSERRATVVVGTLLALGVFEFVLTLAQSFSAVNPDAIVGSFGHSANAVTAAVVLIAACVAVAGYLVRAPFGTLGLASAAILPLFSAWALAKIVPVFLPVVTLAVVAPALVLRQTSWRRAAASMAAVTASAGLVIASYAVFNPDSLKALTSLNYLRNATTSPSSAGQPQLQLAGVILGDYVNASLSSAVVPGSRSVGFKVANVAAGDYTVWMAEQDDAPIRVAQDRSYVFSASVKSPSAAPQTIEPQIEWLSSDGHVIATILGHRLLSFRAGTRLQQLVVSGRTPTGAVSAQPKIAVSGSPPAGSAIFAESLRFKRGTVQSAPPPSSTHNGTGRAGQKPVTPASQRPVPGRLTQWRMAEHAISRSLATKLLGNGLGSATVAVNLGVHPQDLSADAEAASYSDFGTLLVERGWIGLAIVAFFALAIAGTAFRIAQALPHGRWTTALTLAVPGVVATMAAYGMIAATLRSRPVALTFWLVVALGLSPGAFLGGRPWRRASASSSAPTGVE
jgi:hypothetical protein